MYSNSKNRMNSSVNRSSIGQMNINMTNSANRSRKASHDFTGRNLVIVQE